jgi:hypothetical protein
MTEKDRQMKRACDKHWELEEMKKDWSAWMQVEVLLKTMVRGLILTLDDAQDKKQFVEVIVIETVTVTAYSLGR